MRNATVLLLVFLCNSSIYAQQFIKWNLVSLSPKPIIEANLNGIPAYFLLDSGSEITLFHMNDAQRYHFDLLNYVPMGIKKVVSLGEKDNDLFGAGSIDLEIEDLRLKSLFVATDLSDIIKSIRYKTKYRISGIIGSDIMKKYGFMLDYHQKQVLIPRLEKSGWLSR